MYIIIPFYYYNSLVPHIFQRHPRHKICIVSIVTNIAMTHHRQRFDDQVKHLHDDIESLSSMLAKNYNFTALNGSKSSHRQLDTSYRSSTSGHHDHNHSYNHESVDAKGNDEALKNAQETITRLEREVHRVSKERDDLLFRIEHMQKDIDNYRQSIQENGRLKSMYEHLKQDHESLRISLESSDRIRKQQKELIQLLQRSHSIVDNNSTCSVNSYSSLATPRESLVSGHTFTPSIVGENRSWLNTSSGSNHIGIHSHLDNVSTSISGISDRAHKGDGGGGRKKKKIPSSVSSPRSASSKKSTQSRDRSRSVDHSNKVNHINKTGIADTYSRSSSAKNVSSRNGVGSTRTSSMKNQKNSGTSDKKSSVSHALASSNKVRNDYGLLSSIYSAPVVQNPGRPPRPLRMKSY